MFGSELGVGQRKIQPVLLQAAAARVDRLQRNAPNPDVQKSDRLPSNGWLESASAFKPSTRQLHWSKAPPIDGQAIFWMQKMLAITLSG